MTLEITKEVHYLSVFDRDGRPEEKEREEKTLSERDLWDIVGIGLSGSSGISKSASKSTFNLFGNILYTS